MLAGYAGCQILTWPWKVPTVNSVDCVVTFTLLVLLGHANQERDSEADISNGLSMALLGRAFHGMEPIKEAALRGRHAPMCNTHDMDAVLLGLSSRCC